MSWAISILSGNISILNKSKLDKFFTNGTRYNKHQETIMVRTKQITLLCKEKKLYLSDLNIINMKSNSFCISLGFLRM